MKLHRLSNKEKKVIICNTLHRKYDLTLNHKISQESKSDRRDNI